MRRAFAIFATCGLICAVATPASANPFLSVTANHLGGGVVQYTLTGNNDLGGSAALQITAVGVGGNGIVQLLSLNVNPESGAPDGGSDTLAQALAADNIGTSFGVPNEPYNASNGDGGLDNQIAGVEQGNGGSIWDSWWDTTALSSSSPPFNTVTGISPVDGAVGGNIGSNQFSFSAITPAATGASFPIGQIVINDPTAAGLALGAQPVSTVGGFAQMDIIDVFNVGPGLLPGVSIIAAGGLQFSITGSFFVIPEPSSMALLGIGLIGLLTYGWRRRRGTN